MQRPVLWPAAQPTPRSRPEETYSTEGVWNDIVLLSGEPLQQQHSNLMSTQVNVPLWSIAHRVAGLCLLLACYRVVIPGLLLTDGEALLMPVPELSLHWLRYRRGRHHRIHRA